MEGQDEAIDMEVTSNHLLEVVFLILRLQTHFTSTLCTSATMHCVNMSYSVA